MGNTTRLISAAGQQVARGLEGRKSGWPLYRIGQTFPWGERNGIPFTAVIRGVFKRDDEGAWRYWVKVRGDGDWYVLGVNEAELTAAAQAS